MVRLDTVPHEILERIALLTATETFIGPPSTLVTLLTSNRRIHDQLSFASNHYLYSRIFAYKFDVVDSNSRRFIDHSSSSVLAHELIRRFRTLSRFRSRCGLGGAKTESSARETAEVVQEMLFNAYLMMLENAGKNEEQLRDYAGIGDWLKDFLFEEQYVARPRFPSPLEHWPPHNEHTSLAMWLFWFLLRPDEYAVEDDSTWHILNVLKIYALGAHKYPLTDPSWVSFIPSPPPCPADVISPENENKQIMQLKTPPLATPAILSFLTLVNLKARFIDIASHLDLPMKAESNEWEYEMGRCLSLSRLDFDKGGLTESFRPGSIEGIWEGIFTYTEFTAYAALLQGAPPPILQKSVIVRHRQTWKLREYHFVRVGGRMPSPILINASESQDDDDDRDIYPLSAGDPLRAYIPPGAHIAETPEGLEVMDPSRPGELRYYRLAGGLVCKEEESEMGMGRPREVQDIIIMGEGHSAWGQFNLVGRVRPCDGFISLCKEYVDHDRGKWIYRGYLVGNINSNLAGRWRDTLSPAAVPGYEGCFLMTRRR
ncbi:hypothetical protein R3P38DRAFT_2847440 [Favolaschia claudopus]|uniref:F-box domain-containing protein n=1 Tax=Favolaschia claudopus TaxID=2862362 RepID=A0AAW0DTU4_9AGAR